MHVQRRRRRCRDNERRCRLFVEAVIGPGWSVCERYCLRLDSQVVLVAVALDDAALAAVEAELDRQARALPRVDIVRQSIPKSIIVRARSVQEAIAFSNDYAPEHLILHLADAPAAVAAVNAGRERDPQLVRRVRELEEEVRHLRNENEKQVRRRTSVQIPSRDFVGAAFRVEADVRDVVCCAMRRFYRKQ